MNKTKWDKYTKLQKKTLSFNKDVYTQSLQVKVKYNVLRTYLDWSRVSRKVTVFSETQTDESHLTTCVNRFQLCTCKGK